MKQDFQAGGLGLSWEDVPAEIAGAPDALGEWQRLADTYAEMPTRFRRGDRGAVTQYVIAHAVSVHAAAELLRDGLLVDGRSSADRQRRVKSPALSAWVQATTQARHWARELGLSPDARARQGLVEEPERDSDEADVFGLLD
jgi:P27 family predicted phage terminase small subunit